MIDLLPRRCCVCSEAGSTKHSFGTQSLPTVGMYSDIVTAEGGGAQLAFFSSFKSDQAYFRTQSGPLYRGDQGR